MRKRLTKKRLKKHLEGLEKELITQRQQLDSTLKILQASGIIDALNDGQDTDIVTIKKNTFVGFGGYEVHFRVNEVF